MSPVRTDMSGGWEDWVGLVCVFVTIFAVLFATWSCQPIALRSDIDALTERVEALELGGA